MFLVGQLEEHLAHREENSVTAKLGDFAVTDDASLLTVAETHQFPLDEVAAGALTRYLKVPFAYYTKLTPDFQSTLLRYEFDRRKDADAMVESLGHEVLSVHQPSQTMLPLSRVAEVVTKVLKPEDAVRRLITDETRFHLDVTTADHAVTLTDTHESLVREGREVGDITEAGMRVLVYPFQSKKPSVGTYIERLICMNGQCVPERVGQISLKGRTVDEVIASMEEAANLVLSQLDDKLADYTATRTMAVPGSPQAFAAQLARESNVSRQVLDKVLDQINQLPAPVSVWDVQNAFTAVANQVERYSTMVRLQQLGGYLSFDAEQAISRCGTCERLLG